MTRNQVNFNESAYCAFEELTEVIEARVTICLFKLRVCVTEFGGVVWCHLANMSETGERLSVPASIMEAIIDREEDIVCVNALLMYENRVELDATPDQSEDSAPSSSSQRSVNSDTTTVSLHRPMSEAEEDAGGSVVSDNESECMDDGGNRFFNTSSESEGDFIMVLSSQGSDSGVDF